MEIVANLCYLLPLAPLLYTAIRLLRARRRGSASHGRLRLPPGPWQLPVIGSLHHLLGALPHHSLRALSQRHGPFMFLRLGEVQMVVASSAEAAREVLKTQDNVMCTRPLTSCAEVLNERGYGITFEPHGERWRELRKACVHSLLNAKCVRSFRRVREDAAARFVRSISSSSSESSKPMNLSKMIAEYGADATVHSIMGARFKEQDALLYYIDESVRVVGCFTVSDLFPSWRLLRALSGTLRHAAAFRDSSSVFMGRFIDEHLQRRASLSLPVPEEDDVVQVLLKIQREGNLQFPITMGNVKAVLFEMLAGGAEAPVTTLQWAMAELMQNPSMMSRVQNEVRNAFMAQMAVTEEGLDELSYLHCIIKETLRVHTPGPLLVPRQCREQCTILGYDVPKGAVVLINAWAICRDPASWDEPEKFIPDRFMGSAVDYKGNNFEFTPFGGGRRVCPGMLFGLANVELGLASLLFHFDWALPDGILPGNLNMTEAMGITARKKDDLWLRATLRVPLPC